MATDRHRTSRYWATILTVAAIGAVLTVITTWETYDLEQETLEADFLSLAEYRAESCVQAILERTEVLDSIGSLYNASNEVSRDEFGLFAQPCLARLDGVRWLAWIPVVSDSQRQQYELTARREGMEKFQIVEKNAQGHLIRASDRARYLPLYFIEPHTDNAGLMGFDLATDEATDVMLKQTRDTGRTHVAILPADVQAAGAVPCMSIFAPVYDRAGIAFTVKGRQEHLRGYVHGAFDLGPVVDEALRMLKHVDIHICLWHETEGQQRPLHHHEITGEQGETAAGYADSIESAPFRYERRIPIDDGELVIECTSTPAFLKAYGRNGYRWLLLGGFLVTAALVAYIRMHLTRTAEVEKQVSERTQALRQVNDKLTGEVCEREEAEAQLRKAQKNLVEAAHRAGMADVATDVLHNVGNVLNSINVAISRMIDSVIHSKVTSLARVSALLSDHRGDLGTFLTEDDRGKQIPVFLEEVSRRLGEEQSQFADVLDGLAKNVQHVKDIITMQQAYAKVSGMEEQVSMADILEDAIQINGAGLNRHGVRLVREYETLPPVQLNKQKALQIVVNLLSNGKYALSHGEQEDKVLTIRLQARGDEAICIEVIDNGVGIATENLNRIFRHGFTTKREGHGFGLHSGALAAKEMGGTLSVHSDGLGKGAAFTLILPMKTTKVTTCQTTTTKSDVYS